MKKLIFPLLAAIAVLASCSTSASVKGTVEEAPEVNIIAKVLDVNALNVLDTVKTDASGRFALKVPVEKGQPLFVYLYKEEAPLASLLLFSGDKVSLDVSAGGACKIEGSPESVKLQEVEADFNAFLSRMSALTASLEGLDLSSAEAAGIRKEISSTYIEYYRSRVKYIVENSHSLTSVPVLYQNINEDFPVFSQLTDAIHFKNVSDSLKTEYPDSKYVRNLEAEARRRGDILGMQAQLANAEEASFPRLELPDISGRKVKLRDVDSKVVMVYFWSSDDAATKMFNLDVVKPLYEAWKDKGFDIYQVSLDTDKAAWAATVRSQELPWTNVCDGLGAASPSVLYYNVSAIPVAYFIVDGELYTGSVDMTKDGLNRFLRSVLR